jgi:DNA topoisomerase-1
VFYGCVNYPKCDFTLWNKPIPESRARSAHWPFLTEKITKRHGRQLICSNEECGYVRQAELEEAEATDLGRWAKGSPALAWTGMIEQ